MAVAQAVHIEGAKVRRNILSYVKISQDRAAANPVPNGGIYGYAIVAHMSSLGVAPSVASSELYMLVREGSLRETVKTARMTYEITKEGVGQLNLYFRELRN